MISASRAAIMRKIDEGEVEHQLTSN